MNEDELVTILSDKNLYPEKPDSIHVIQTHISIVILTGKHAYKFKKPVNFGFLDFGTLEKRKFYCEEEVRLNRRLSPEIYLGIVELKKNPEDGKISLHEKENGNGKIFEYGIKMKQLSEDNLMSLLIKKEKITIQTIKDIVKILVKFYNSAETNNKILGYGTVEMFRKNTDENFDQTENMIGRTITAEQFKTIKNATENFYRKNVWLFEKRIREDKIRECHGDLHSGNIFIDNKIHIFDCIEFNKRFRYSDIAADIAFLAMDLDYLGRSDLSKELVELFTKESKDYDILKIINFYKCYRAYVRAKVTAFLISDPAINEKKKEDARTESAKYFDLAEKYAKTMENCPVTFKRPLLIISSSCSGEGKSYILKPLSTMLGLDYISTDTTRKEFFKVEPDAKIHTDYGSQIYSSENRQKIYNLMLNRAEELIKSGKGCILDATFIRKDLRAKAMDIAKRLNADFIIIHPYLDKDIAKKRILSRMTNTNNPSDAKWDTYLKQKQLFEPFDDIEKRYLIEIDSEPKLCYEHAFDKVVEKVYNNQN